MRKIPKLLSKTKLLRGYRCLKNIYLTLHDPDLEAPITEEQQALFDQGNLVGEKARERYPGGVLIDNKPWDFFGSLKATRELIRNGTHVIYEAAFEYKGCYARADIIRFDEGSKRWTIWEVKSSTKVKPEQLDDVGLQVWIIANSGLPIERINVLHLNSDCRFPDLEKLFIETDVTDALRASYPSITPRINEISSTVQKDAVPSVDIGAHCLKPNECGFLRHCWTERKIPEVSIFDLPQIRDRQWDLYKQGIIDLKDVRLNDLTPLQQRVVDAHKTGQRFIDKEGIRKSLQSWRFPLVFLDFETINPAIPRYKGCGPYSHAPFQFSVHILNSWNSDLQHMEYLHDEASDPRPKLIPVLLNACGDSGSIVAYYGRFETDRIREMADCFPEWNSRLASLISRIVDPLPVIRDFVYDQAFRGSFSLKAVAPAILGNSFSYDGMLVSDGTAAQRTFEEMISPRTSPIRKEELRIASLDYCKKDTLVMVELVKWLYEVSRA